MSQTGPRRGRGAGPAPMVLVPSGASFMGLVAFRGAVRLEGRVRGSVVARGSLEIGREGEFVGDVEVDTLRVAGHLNGDAFVRERAELEAGAHVEGAVEAPVVVVADGCRLDGSLSMGRLPRAPEAAPREGAGEPSRGVAAAPPDAS